MELVRARLGLHGDDTRRRLPELGVVVLRGDLRLADRLEVGVDDDDAEDRVAVLGAVELIARAAEVLAVDLVWIEPCGFSLAACCQPSCWVPGVSRMNLVKLRSRTGSSVICSVVERVATSARSVLRSGEPPVTSPSP